MTLTTAYFPPIEYFAVLAKYSVISYDTSENYQKQSYRNRCRILASDGPLDLRFPIIHDGRKRITEVRVDYSTPWIRQTEYAIETAYGSSPYFEYYKDELYAVLESRPETLWVLNREITEFFCRKIGINPPVEGLSFLPEDVVDIHPKHPSQYVGKEYWQVFRDKFGFVPGLSIMDLLFNEGPESLCYLK